MDEQIGVIELAQYLIGLLDAASFDTTYKLATLEALIRAVSEDLGPNGEPRDRISAREISQHVLIRYWNQTANFVGGPAAEEGFLRQRSGGRGGDLVERVRTVREALSLTTRSDSLVHARMIAPVEVGKLERLTWERVVDMPIPRLQRFGSGGSAVENRFLYDYDWGREGKETHLLGTTRRQCLSAAGCCCWVAHSAAVTGAAYRGAVGATRCSVESTTDRRGATF